MWHLLLLNEILPPPPFYVIISEHHRLGKLIFISDFLPLFTYNAAIMMAAHMYVY